MDRRASEAELIALEANEFSTIGGIDDEDLCI